MPFITSSFTETIASSQPESQKKLVSRHRSYVDNDLDGSQAYLSTQNTVTFPGDKSEDGLELTRVHKELMGSNLNKTADSHSQIERPDQDRTAADPQQTF